MKVPGFAGVVKLFIKVFQSLINLIAPPRIPMPLRKLLPNLSQQAILV
jgi:hypothetical protein